MACGSATPAPAPSEPPARPPGPQPVPDRVAGCWRDGADGLVLCLEETGYVLFLRDGKWDRVVVDWAKKTPERRSGRTRTPRPLWLSLELRGDLLAMDDGTSETLLDRPPAHELAQLERRLAALPSIAEVCARAEACRKAAAGVLGRELEESAEDLAGSRACIGFLNGIAEIFRRTERLAPAECR
jgi:hypothetical protein